MVNKIDKKDARPQEVLSLAEDLFLELSDDESSLDFTVIYGVGRDGKAFYELPETYDASGNDDLTPLFETILKDLQNVAVNDDKPFQMLISTLDYDNYVGKICIGKVSQGTLSKGQQVTLINEDVIIGSYRVEKLYTSNGLMRDEVQTVTSGDIAAIAGISELTIGQTVTDPANPKSLPKIAVEEPTIKISIGPNTSPFAGREGQFTTSRQIKERLTKEKETNLGLKIEDDVDGRNFAVSGRGELHLSVLIENMRREGYEMQISKPQVIYKEVDGVVAEPYEEVTIDVGKEHVGAISEEFGTRKGEMLNMNQDNNNNTRLVFKISSQNLLGIRNILLTKTRGTAIMNTYFLGYLPKGVKMESIRNGALIASETGKTSTPGPTNKLPLSCAFARP